jgi:hypothetical protein
MKKSRPKNHFVRNSKIDTLVLILIILLIPSLGIMFWGIHNLNNYINWLKLPFSLAILGIIVALGVNYIINKFLPEAENYKHSNGGRIKHLLIFIFVPLFIGAGAVLNDSFNKSVKCNSYKIIRLNTTEGKRPKYEAYVNDGNGTVRLLLGWKFNDTHTEGENVDLCIVTGILGFKYHRLK